MYFLEYESNSYDYYDFGIDARTGPSRSSPRSEERTTTGVTTRGPKTAIVTKGTGLLNIMKNNFFCDNYDLKEHESLPQTLIN